MSPHGKERMPTPKQKLIHNPIPTSFLLFVCVNILLVEKVSILPAVSSSKNNRYLHIRKKQDVGIGL